MPINKVKQWDKARKKLKVIYENKGITTCEIRLKGCWINNGLSFAHRHKRNWYNLKPELLGSFDETLLSCISCHQKIENDKELTEKLFKQLR